MRRIATAIFVLCLAPNLASACWDEAGERYGVSPHLLYAMARVESSLNPAAVNNSQRGLHVPKPFTFRSLPCGWHHESCGPGPTARCCDDCSLSIAARRLRCA